MESWFIKRFFVSTSFGFGLPLNLQGQEIRCKSLSHRNTKLGPILDMTYNYAFLGKGNKFSTHALCAYLMPSFQSTVSDDNKIMVKNINKDSSYPINFPSSGYDVFYIWFHPSQMTKVFEAAKLYNVTLLSFFSQEE